MHDAINKRISTRTFKNEPLTTFQIKEIQDVVEKHTNVNGPFDHKFEFTFNLNNSKEKSLPLKTRKIFGIKVDKVKILQPKY